MPRYVNIWECPEFQNLIQRKKVQYLMGSNIRTFLGSFGSSSFKDRLLEDSWRTLGVIFERFLGDVSECFQDSFGIASGGFSESMCQLFV